METSRRSLLKLFGIGAVIAPIVRGVATSDQAVIVKPPEVELVKAAEIVRVPSSGEFGDSDIIMFVRNGRSGLTFTVTERPVWTNSLLLAETFRQCSSPH
jgi:hypothetical protein